jgi:hypothetical protein
VSGEPPDGFSHVTTHRQYAKHDLKISKFSNFSTGRLCRTPAPASAGAAWDSRTTGAREARVGARGVTVQPRTRGKNGATTTPDGGLNPWPVTVRPLRAWCEPGIRRGRSWRAWSATPPPPALQWLLDGLWEGRGIAHSVREHPTTARKRGPRSPGFSLHIVLVIPLHLL